MVGRWFERVAPCAYYWAGKRGCAAVGMVVVVVVGEGEGSAESITLSSTDYLVNLLDPAIKSTPLALLEAQS